MIKIIDKTFKKDEIESANIRTTEGLKEKINSWMFDSNKPGIDYLMATINEVEKRDYNPFLIPIENDTFKMTTKDDDSVTFKLIEGDIEDEPILRVITEDMARNYSCTLDNNKYEVKLSSADIKLNNGYILHQYLFDTVDAFEISNKNHKIYFHIQNPKKSNKPYLIPFHSQLIKRLGDLEDMSNIDQLFDILYSLIKDSHVENYTLSIVGKEGYSNISVKNGSVSNLTKTINGNKYSIDTTTSPYTLYKNDVALETKEEVIQKLMRK